MDHCKVHPAKVHVVLQFVFVDEFLGDVLELDSDVLGFFHGGIQVQILHIKRSKLRVFPQCFPGWKKRLSGGAGWNRLIHLMLPLEAGTVGTVWSPFHGVPLSLPPKMVSQLPPSD